MIYPVRPAFPRRVATVSALLLGFGLAVPASQGAAQFTSQPDAAVTASFASLDANSVYVAPGKYAVVVDLSEHRLYFRHGESILWSSEIGTGTGLVLRGDSTEWEFSTPRGSFQVQYKAENPDWLVPDWYFIEKGLPVPPADSPERRRPGGLGKAAVYLGHQIAIHGTDKPELLGQPVSHGCIRLPNEYAVRLFHNVQIGTEVIIVGESDPIDMETAKALVEKAQQLERERADAPEPPDPLSELETGVLVTKLEEEIRIAEFGPEVSNWTDLAHRLVTRGIEGDAEALSGLLRLARVAEETGIDVEYSTFLADAYSRGVFAVLSALAGLSEWERDAAARAIVAATMGMYAGAQEDVVEPWPTRRLPRRFVDAEALPGWEALEAAENAYRSERENPYV